MADGVVAQGGGKSKHYVLAGLFGLMGLGILGTLFVCTLLQIQTNEAYLGSTGAISLNPNWAIVLQPWNYVHGMYGPADAKSIMISWIVEVFNLVFSIGYEIACESVFRANRSMIGWFRTLAKGILIFNMWTDFQYGPNQGGGWIEQLIFSVAVAFVVYFFGVVGVRFIEQAIAELR